MNILREMAMNRDLFFWLCFIGLAGGLITIVSGLAQWISEVRDARKRRTHYPFDGNKGGRL